MTNYFYYIMWGARLNEIDSWTFFSMRGYVSLGWKQSAVSFWEHF